VTAEATLLLDERDPFCWDSIGVTAEESDHRRRHRRALDGAVRPAARASRDDRRSRRAAGRRLRSRELGDDRAESLRPLAAPGMVALGLKWMLSPESPFYIRPRASLDLIRWGWRFMRAANAAHVARAAPLLRDLHLASRACYEQWSDEFSDAFGLVRKGLLMLCKTEHGLREEAKTADVARQLGVPAEVLDRNATEALEPALRFDIAGAVYYPRDCHLTPETLIAAHACSHRRCGPAVGDNRHAMAHERRARGADRAHRGDLAGDEFVLAAECGRPTSPTQLGVHVPMQAERATITLQSPPRVASICAI
jgi:D-amino-acid dehydrogenase